MTAECNNKVYKYGTSVGMFDMSKDDAEAFCKEQTEKTGVLHDWHYIAGRVHVKALYPSELLTVIAQRDELLAAVKGYLANDGSDGIYHASEMIKFRAILTGLIAKCEAQS